MKKINTLLLALLLLSQIAAAQTADTPTIGKNQFAISGNTYSFFQTIENNATWNRSVYIYPRQAVRPKNGWRRSGWPYLTAFQLFRDLSRVSGAQTTAGIFKDTTTANAKIYMASTTLNDFSTIFTWDSVLLLPKMTKVFDGSIKPYVDTSSGYKTFPVGFFMPDTSKNIVIAVEYRQSSGTAGQMFWAYDTTSAFVGGLDSVNYFSSLQFRFCHKPFSQTDSFVNRFTGSNIRHPHIKFIYRYVIDATDDALAEKTILPESLQISPNPVSSSGLTLDFTARRTAEGQASVSNLLGKIFFKKTLSILRGDNRTVLNVADLPQGVYFLSINDGTTLTTRQFVKL